MNRALRRTIFKLAHACGYTVIPNWRVDYYAQAMFLRDLFAYLHVDCVFDVGANVGQYRDFLRREVDYEGTIVSFEPIPENIALLRDRAKADPRWIVEGYALGRTAGAATFNVMRSSEFSSFLPPERSASPLFAESNAILRRIDVEVKTLEQVFPGVQHHGRALYLKLDTQGYDLEVAGGAGDVIRNFCALQSEASVNPLYEGMPDYRTTIRTFEALGFELSALFPNNPQHFPRMFEFDCHMISRAARGDDR
jgi:FkbM family methyltransferase